MRELIKHGTKIDFVKTFPVIFGLSVVLMIWAVYGVFARMNYGVDFRGGAEVQVRFKENVAMDAVRSALSEDGFKGVSVQTIGEEKDHEVLVKVQASEAELNAVTTKVGESLNKRFSAQGAEVQKVDIVGPKAGKQLRFSAMQAMMWALVAIMIYIGVRFDFRYAPGAFLSLFHDVVVVAGVVAWTGNEFSLQTVAALLSIIGYSINDTCIIYDRIREHEDHVPGLTFGQHINEAVNDTLSRTIITAGATLLVSATMFFIGGAAIRDFFFAMTTGIVFGVYSSIFVASALTYYTDAMLVKKNEKTQKALA